MFEPDRHHRAVAWVAKQVTRLRPGEHITVGGDILRDIEPMRYNGAQWTPADRVMENIMGSSVEYRYWFDPIRDDRVTFERLPEPLTDGRRSYVSPDRQHYFRRAGDIWHPKTESPKGNCQSRQDDN